MTDPITRLNAALEGRYRVERELGEGGMATVYLAEDLRHERKVALKVLKPELAAVVGAERFLAEIKTTANLQHPHILPLFDSGQAEGFLYYVMPYVEGESLRDRIDREKQLPVDEAVRIATEVADALQAAHEQGVVHRDIKPANILLSRGRPLVADFGIALAVTAAGGGRLTETGLSMGTPYYMSPEQASADRDPSPASDVYSLACVLYEMLAGEPPYSGTSAQAILAKILTEAAPDPTKVRASVPANVDSAIRKALEKLPADRFTSAQDLARALVDSGFRHGRLAGREISPDTRAWKRLTIAGWGSAVFLGAGLAWALLSVNRAPSEATPTYLSLSTPAGVVPFDPLIQSAIAISPDGRRVVYIGSSPGQPLFLQDLDAVGDAQPIRGTEGAVAPFFSPDGEWIGFGADNALQKVSLSGSLPTRVADASRFRGGSWSPDGSTIYYTPRSSVGIWRVSADGGEAEEITRPVRDGLDNEHYGPEALPGGEGILFTSCCSQPRVMHLNLATREVTPLVEGFYGRYASTGHLVFMQPGSLLAATFDPLTLEVGTPTEVADDVLDGLDMHAEFAFSRTGSLAYLSGPSMHARTLFQYDRSGSGQRLFPEPRGSLFT